MLDLRLRREKMSEEFTKFHIEGLPIDCAIHTFTNADKGFPHDHPWGFKSYVLYGGYLEKVYYINADGTWESEIIHRKPGDVFELDAEHIHELIELPNKISATVITPMPWKRDWGFWDFSGPIAKFINSKHDTGAEKGNYGLVETSSYKES